jgi:cobalt-zinc-cadmium efflux system protein
MANDHMHEAIPSSGKRLAAATVLNLLITVAEVVGGILGGSLALLSDAMHNFSDAVALVISGIAMRLARQPKTNHYTFGLKRAEILAAALNAAVLVLISAGLIREAYDRLSSPELPSADLMIVIGAIGLGANVAGTLLLRQDARKNLNLRSAYVHLLSDALSSVGVVVGGIAIRLWSVAWVDPLITVLIALYVLRESYAILRHTTNIVLMATPSSISIDEVSMSIWALPGVQDVHHAHMWQMTEEDVHFEAHVTVEDMPVSATEKLLHTIEEKLNDKFHIRHVTIQFECDRCESRSLLAQ